MKAVLRSNNNLRLHVIRKREVSKMKKSLLSRQGRCLSLSRLNIHKLGLRVMVKNKLKESKGWKVAIL
jgi:hypothetical protein